MPRLPRVMRPLQDDESGFTLIEVVVSLVLLGIVATASLYFFLEGTRTTSHLQRSQNAVAVANEAMERAYGLDPKDKIGTTTPSIVVGRAQADVVAAWSTASGLGAEGLAQSYALWDPTATSSTAAALPVKYTTEHSGQTYNVTTLVGSCFRARNTVATDQTCQKLPGYASDPGDAATPAAMVRMLRITTLVTWEPTAGECTGGLCSYQLSGLVDRSGDLKWNQVVEPVAVNDFENFVINEPQREIKVLANDLMGPVGSNPVQVLSTPAQGTLTAPTGAGVLKYTVPPNASGIFTFTYRIKDARGAQSDPGTVTLTIPPQSSNDSVRVMAGQSNPIDILANDLGTKATVAVTAAPGRGSLTISGTAVSYKPNAGVTSGTDSFTYTYTDPSGQVSPPATVTVKIDNIAIQDRTIAITHSATLPQWTDLTPMLTAGNTDLATMRVIIAGPKPADGTLQVDGATYTSGTSAPGAVVRYDPANKVGTYTFQYALARTDGSVSAARSVTIQVFPSATPEDVGSFKRNTKTVFDPVARLGANDFPVVGGASATEIVLGAPSANCGSFSTSSGTTYYNAPDVARNSSPKSCSATYTIQGVAPNQMLASPPVTFTWQVYR